LGLGWLWGWGWGLGLGLGLGLGFGCGFGSAPAVECQVAAGARPAGVRAAYRAAARVGYGSSVDGRGDGQHDGGRAAAAQVGHRGEVRVDAFECSGSG